MSNSIMIAAAEAVNLHPAPITPNWILSGQPETRSKELARSKDGTSYTMVWDCTAGQFNWHYNKDEALVVVTDESFITFDGQEERRIAPGDAVFFPCGVSAKWRVPNYIRKVAFVRHTMPRPAGYGVIAWNLFLRIFRGGGGGL